MISRINKKFRKTYQDLPTAIRKKARNAYKQFQRDPYHPSLQFKSVHTSKPIYSVRISDDYRVLGILNNDEIVWFWIGSHADYDKLLSQI